MRITDHLTAYNRGNPLLWRGVMLNAALAVIFAALAVADQRLVTGAITWLKPMKFAFSFVVFLQTFIIVLHYLRDDQKKRISRILFATMVFEIVPISVQAARGVPSHYNVTAWFDIVLFQIMGLFILVNTVAVCYILFLYSKPLHHPLRADRKAAVQAGLVLFLAGAISGGIMVANSGHAIGAADGGPGVAVLNWSTNAGDLRVAHFFTLHGLQFLMAAGWLLSGWRRNARVGILGIAVAYAAFCVLLHERALAGEPLIAGPF